MELAVGTGKEAEKDEVEEEKKPVVHGQYMVSGNLALALALAFDKI